MLNTRAHGKKPPGKLQVRSESICRVSLNLFLTNGLHRQSSSRQAFEIGSHIDFV